MDDEKLDWFGVRCVFAWSGWDGKPYEERITLWRARSLDRALQLAGQDAAGYADEHSLEFLEFSQAYAIREEELGSGAEVFSLLRDSDLAPEEYLTAFFDTGREHLTEVAGPVPESGGR